VFIKKITNKLSLFILNSAFFICLFSTNLHAHEMWIEPIKYAVKSGEGILAHETIGQNFKGNTYAYIDDSFETLNISVNDTTIKVKSRLGDLPAIQEKTNQEGLHVIYAATTPSIIKYSTPEKFKNFVDNEGLDWVLSAHKKRNIFNKKTRDTPSAEVIKTQLKTDAEGRIEIPKAKGGLFLINSVKMIEPSADIVKRSDAVWESIWASLSYEILPNI